MFSYVRLAEPLPSLGRAMKLMLVAGVVAIAGVLALGPIAAAQYRQEKDKPYRPPADKGMYGSGPGDMRPRAPKVEEREELVSTKMDEQWKWFLGAVVVAMIGFTLWRVWSEASKVRPASERKPWEIE
jgi:hypothetical protein